MTEFNDTAGEAVRVGSRILAILEEETADIDNNREDIAVAMLALELVNDTMKRVISEVLGEESYVNIKMAVIDTVANSTKR